MGDDFFFSHYLDTLTSMRLIISMLKKQWAMFSLEIHYSLLNLIDKMQKTMNLKKKKKKKQKSERKWSGNTWFENFSKKKKKCCWKHYYQEFSLSHADVFHFNWTKKISRTFFQCDLSICLFVFLIMIMNTEKEKSA